MIITRNNFETLKKAALNAAGDHPGIIKAIQETETAAAAASAKAAAYITEKRKTNKKYCH